MTNSNNNLLPCPFCGSHKVGIASEHDSDTGGVFLSVKCSACRASSGTSFSTNACPQTYQEVRDEWNRRSTAALAQSGEQAGYFRFSEPDNCWVQAADERAGGAVVALYAL